MKEENSFSLGLDGESLVLFELGDFLAGVSLGFIR